jgi:pyrophosphatase PpaX
LDSPIACVLFDVDGTLVDTTNLIAEGLQSTLESHLGRRPPRAEIVSLIGRPLIEQLREYVEEPFVPPLAERFMTFYEENRAGMEAFFPGALNMLHAVRRLRLTLGLVTSKNRREIEGTLELLGFTHLLDFVISSEDAPRPKPFPDPVVEAVRRAEAKPEETLFIGDSIYDMQSGKAAGVRTGAALWGPFGRAILEPQHATYPFETPEDATAAIERLAASRQATPSAAKP